MQYQQAVLEDIRNQVDELLTWEVETGQPLPLPAAEIARIEATGAIVDLETGEIVNPNADLQMSLDIEIAGTDAGAIARGLRTAIDVGSLDLAVLNLLREELRGATGDWRIVSAKCSNGEVQP